MPIIQAQKKSVRQSQRRRLVNDRRRRAMREAVKSLKESVASKDYKAAMEKMPQAYQAIDKAVKRGVIKANTGSRKKSHLARIVKEIA
jgi:small subunit ribosomal protein S20